MSGQFTSKDLVEFSIYKDIKVSKHLNTFYDYLFLAQFNKTEGKPERQRYMDSFKKENEDATDLKKSSTSKLNIEDINSNNIDDNYHSSYSDAGK